MPSLLSGRGFGPIPCLIYRRRWTNATNPVNPANNRDNIWDSEQWMGGPVRAKNLDRPFQFQDQDSTSMMMVAANPYWHVVDYDFIQQMKLRFRYVGSMRDNPFHYRPIPHPYIVDLVLKEMDWLDIKQTRQAWLVESLDPTTSTGMWGCIDFDPTSDIFKEYDIKIGLDHGCDFTLGIYHDNSSTFALKYMMGVRVRSTKTAYIHTHPLVGQRHTRRGLYKLEETTKKLFQRYIRGCPALVATVRKLRNIQVRDHEASYIIMEASKAGALPHRRIQTIYEFFTSPPPEWEFMGRDAWSLHHAIASICPKISPMHQVGISNMLAPLYREVFEI